VLRRAYLVFGSLVLLGYVVATTEGWELGNPNRQRHGRYAWWFVLPGSDSSGTRSGVGGGGGGK
jgi:hypothetical protein